jgi:ABC-type Co2+ transport system permease subunit
VSLQWILSAHRPHPGANERIAGLLALLAALCFLILAIKTGLVLPTLLYVGLFLLALAMSPLGVYLESRGPWGHRG